MRKIICILLAAMTAQIALAADTDDAIGLVEKYWEARNSKDYATQFDLMSEKGTLGANSNGTFFQDAERGTVEEMEEDLSNIANSDVTVRYPEAIQLAPTVILTRYYLEGPIEFTNGTRQPNYRTRVTHIWVREGDAWKTRSWHFSPLHNGGVFAD